MVEDLDRRSIPLPVRVGGEVPQIAEQKRDLDRPGHQALGFELRLPDRRLQQLPLEFSPVDAEEDRVGQGQQ